ncbi:MAG: efflux RND transporter permease subunit [Myxococcales bacterium]|nr:efflux RND transporter permease subunit [Myxococcales bacterium]MCB9629850.1 efflux RND transporter permease subunit [Sandaracinaceae bacterium]
MIERLLLGSITKRKLVLAVVAALAAASLLSARNLRLDALPDVTGQQVMLLTRAPGYTPEEVERLVTRPVEIALGGLPGLETQRSLSRYGLSVVTAVFHDDVDLVRARQLVAERLVGLPQLPAGVETPELGPMTGGLGEIYHFAVEGEGYSATEILELVELRVAPVLRSVPGVVEVNTWGGTRRTLDVVGDPLAMSAHGVSLAELRAAVETSSGAVPGDALSSGAGRTLLRGRALPAVPEDLARGVLRVSPDGSTVRIGDVASVRPGAEPRLGTATSEGRGEGVYVMVQMLRGENALMVLDAIHARLPDVRAALPGDVHLEPIYDRSELVHATLRTVGKNLLEGGLLVAIILFLTLGSLRAALVVALTIPLAMLGAVVGMVALDVPGNLMSLGAIDFGLLVDGAVVLVEAIFHRWSEHPDEDPAHAMRRAVTEVARPVAYSVAVILMVYVPILALQGVDGKMFKPMAITVVLALAAALVLTFTFIPAATATLVRREHMPATAPRLVRALARLHAPILGAASRHPLLLTGLALLTLAGGGLLFARAGTAFVPQLDEGDLVVQVTRNPDISIAEAARLGTALEVAAREVPEVAAIYSRIGSPAVATDVMGLEQSDVFVRLRPPSEWRAGLTRDQLLTELGERIEATSPGDEVGFTQPIQMRFNELLGGDVTDVSVSVFGPDLATARGVAEEIERRIGDLPGAEDVRVLAPPAVPLFDVVPDALRAARHGLRVADVLDAVQAYQVGLPAGATYEDVLRIPIRVRLAPPTHEQLGNTPIPAPGGLVPLTEVARVQEVETPSVIHHDRTERRVAVGFNVRGRDLGSVAQEAQQRLVGMVVPEGYRPVWGGQYEAFEAAKRRLMWVVPLVLLGIAAVLLLLFRRLQPVIIIALHIPFAAVGGIVALSLRDLPISISAAIGFIALSGIAVLNGVVLVARIEDEVRAGKDTTHAALDAARARLRPVSTTALVASFGFVPMMLATGAGAEVQRPLATVVVGGLVTSTTVSLLLLPVLYPYLARLLSARAPRNPLPSPSLEG